MNMMTHPALLALEDGSLFNGISIGSVGQTVGEVVFNTAMTGYQEILTDPSYARQIVTFTYPHIGNTGVNHEDAESSKIWAAGLVIRDLPLLASNWRMQESFPEYLRANHLVAIAQIDTRRLTRLLREKGALNGCIMAGEVDEAAALIAAKNFPGIKGMDLAKVVSTTAAYEWASPTDDLPNNEREHSSLMYHVIAYDFGIKYNILRKLVDVGCRVTVVPAKTSAAEVLAMKPDGIVLSNGPGDPEPCEYAIEAIQALLKTSIPLFGICLGHQLLGLACGAKTIKMKFGHHGSNHPVQDIQTKQVMITTQNHGFAVDESTLPSELKAIHRSLFDNSLQGIHHTTQPVFSVQGHPEASPGPHDTQNLFTYFVTLMRQYKTSQ